MGQQMEDMIVEQGTSGIWRYRLWQSGFAECWGKKEVNTAFNTQWGSLYASDDNIDAESFPFTFKAIPYEQLNISKANYAAWLYRQPNGDTTTKKTGVYKFLRPTNVVQGSIFNVDYYIAGRWK